MQKSKPVLQMKMFIFLPFAIDLNSLVVLTFLNLPTKKKLINRVYSLTKSIFIFFKIMKVQMKKNDFSV